MARSERVLPFLKKAGNMILHPVAIALALTIVIIWLFLPHYEKYKLEIAEERQLFDNGAVVVYDDLDNNGYSDKIEFSSYSNGVHYVSVLFEPNLFFQEWDLPGNDDFTRAVHFITGDREGDGKKELYVFTLKGDSVMMHAISSLYSDEPEYASYFITRIGNGGDRKNTAIITGEMDDLNDDGSREVIFAVNTGFSLIPRTVFAADLKNSAILSSPHAGYHILELRQADLSGDGKNEIIVNGYASQNYKSDTPVINDDRCWLIVLDRKLNYYFPPVAFNDTGYSTLYTWPVSNAKGVSELYSFYAPPLLTKKPARLYHWDREGRISDSLSLPDQSYQKTTSCVLMVHKGKPYFGFGNKEGIFRVYDTAFQFFRQFPTPYAMSVQASLDIDDDGSKEDIVVDQMVKQLAIYNGSFDHPAVIKLGLEADDVNVVSLKKVPGKPPLLHVISGNTTFLISYSADPLYWLRWGIYTAIFISIYLFIILIRRIQAIQLAAGLQAERKITDLQLKVIRNQMDPHFSLNAINSVISSIQQNEKEIATHSLIRFSKMFRAMVLSGDKIERTLAEELDFTRNYLELEQFRFRDTFEFRIEIDAGVDLEWKVPKMIVQSPAENAVKHGLLPKQSGGILAIRAYAVKNTLFIEVEDNGYGRGNGTFQNVSGTGMGLRIMEEFIAMYKKLRKVNIGWKVEDIKNPAGEPAGTKVVITISV